MMRSAVPILAALAALAALASAGCGGSGARASADAAAPAAEDRAVDPQAVLVEALRSPQPPLQAIEAEVYVDSAPASRPVADLVAVARSNRPRPALAALAALGQMKRSDLVPVYRQALASNEPVIRLAAAYALAMSGDPSEMSRLREALSHPDLAVRRTAVWLLGLMGNRSASGMLEVKLDDPDALVVLRAAEALHRLGSDTGLERVRRLTEHPRHEVRYYAVRLLGRMGSREDIPRLERLAQSKRYLDVKAASMAALARLGEMKQMSLLVDLLEIPDDAVRVLAARELGPSGYEPAAPALTRLMVQGGPLERVTAAASIVRIRAMPQPWRQRLQTASEGR